MSHFVYCVNYKHTIQIDKNTFGCVSCLLVFLCLLHMLVRFVCVFTDYARAICIDMYYFSLICKLFRSNEAELLAHGLALR